MGSSSGQHGTITEQHGTISEQQRTIRPLGSRGSSSGQHGTITDQHGTILWAAEDYPSSEQHGRFIASYAAIHSRRHLEHTSAPHSSSSGCERVLEHSAHFSTFSIDTLLSLAKGGLGSLWRTRGAIFSR